MKPVIFTEDRLANLEEIGAALFSDDRDPRSTAYVRTHIRPKLNWFKVTGYLLLPVLAVIIFIFSIRPYRLGTALTVWISAAMVIAYILITLKQAITYAVKIYQRFAPDSLRDKCRFEPSCSEYMILAVEKYGVWKGVKKGLNRLKRCNVDGGGYDYP